ncbi:hypothetical protein NT6N_39570 [Oceaniferula spumae]|uniref:LamG-like jellyroll fold domain-containing protein n=1 Tax=Oceaniferula spumae TaxID=2979115 RepID=A0AAT9FRY4_9BACT
MMTPLFRIFASLLLSSQFVAAQRPAGHWAFDGEDGAKRLEESYGRTELNAAESGGAASWQTRAGFGYSLAIGSTSNYLSVPNLEQISPGNDSFSLSVWLKRDSINSGSGIFDALSGTGTGYQLFVQSNNILRLRLDDDQGHSVNVDTTSTLINTNTWLHIYAEVDRASNTAKIFINGTESTGGGVNISALTGDIIPDQPLQIGTLNGGSPTDGSLDDAAIFLRKLTPAELSAIAGGATIVSQFPPLPSVEITPDSTILRPGDTISLSSAPGTTIYYTLDGSDPTESSPSYSGPFTLTNSAKVKARVFSGGANSTGGPITSAYFTLIPEQKPNVILIVADDLGFNDLGCYGAATVATPNLDALAYSGVRFTQFTTSGPSDVAAQYALLTGRVVARSAMSDIVASGSTGIDRREWTLHEAMKKSGYHTAMIGAWHLGDATGSHPTAMCTDLFYGLPYSPSLSPFPPLVENATVIDASPAPANLLDQMTQRAKSWLSTSDGPFFLCFQPPSMTSTGNSLLGAYGNRIEAMDQAVGEILATLQSEGLDSNTLVIFISDSGANRNTGSYPTGSNGQLRDGKGTTWEGGIRTPVIARWPGVIPAGVDSQALVWLPDLFPSLLEIIQGWAPGDRTLDGISQPNTLLGGETVPDISRVLFSYRHESVDWALTTVRQGPWKLHRSYINSDPINGISATAPLLYQVENDPTERIQRQSTHGTVVNELQALVTAQQNSLQGNQLPPIEPVKLTVTDIDDSQPGKLRITFTRPAASLNDHYLLQHSNDLDDWDDLPLTNFIQSTTLLADEREQVIIEVLHNHPGFNSPDGKHFIRIQSNQP